jgi:hypothetical protein
MHASQTSAALVSRVMFAAVFVLAMVSTLPGQTLAPKPSVTTKQIHCHKYVNRTYGFSLRYPDNYTSVPHPDAEGRCPDNDDYKCLLWLARPDNRDGSILVTLDLQPFHLTPNAGDVMPTRQLIGRHVFYGGIIGSMAVGFSDYYEMNLKGKTLTITFGPDDDSANPSDETRQLEHKMLKTLRTF